MMDDATATDEQRALRGVARDLVRELNPPDRLRALWDGRVRDRGVWRKLAEVGLTGIGVPEEDGGTGGDLDTLVVVLEEAGYAALPEPLGDTVAIAVPALRAAGGELARAWLPRIATGEAMVAVTLPGSLGALDADVADALLVGRDGALRLVERHAVTATPLATEDGTRRLHAVTVADGAGVPVAADVREVHARAATATAATLVGVSRWLLDTTVDHAKVRHQFGRPIGSFQAVAHVLASLVVDLGAARGLVRAAARAIGRGHDDASLAASVAKAATSDVARRIDAAALQFHGGIGFTWEHDLHLWSKRALALAAQHGDDREHRAAIAAAVLDGAG